MAALLAALAEGGQEPARAAAFRSRFCPNDDGHATARLLGEVVRRLA
jgi:hypothetical protein